MTGLISSDTTQYVYVSVVSKEATLTVSVDKSEYCPLDVINISNIVENTGTMNITAGNLTTRILNPSGSPIHNESWTNEDLLIGESKTYNSYYTVTGNEISGNAQFGFIADGNYSYDDVLYRTSSPFWIQKDIGLFRYSPNSIEKTIDPGNNDTETITLWLDNACQDTFVTMNKSSGIPGDWVNFTKWQFPLSLPNPWNQTDVIITVNSSAAIGDYSGTIYATADGNQISIPLTVHVTGLTFTLNVTTVTKFVCQGELATAVIDVEKNQEGPLDVNMTYRISNSTTLISEINTTLHIDNMTAQDISSLTVPSSTAEGTYTFTAILQYNDTQTQSSDTFQVIKCFPTTTVPPGPSRGPSPPTIVIPKYGLNLRLSKTVLAVITGNRTSFIAFVNSTGTNTVKSVKILTEGIPLNWIETLPMMSDISPGQIKEYLVVINVPKNAEPGIYKLNVVATDSVESNEETLTLIIGRDPKEIAGLLLSEMENVRSIANQSLLVEDCIDISLIKSMYQDAEIARENGLKEYQAKNYVSAINWFEYAFPIYQQIVTRVDITVQVEIESTKKSEFIIPPGFDPEKQYSQAEIYLSDKNYERVCDPIVKIRNLILIGIVFWPTIIIIGIILIIVFILLYKKKREIDRERTIKKVKKRLGISENQ